METTKVNHKIVVVKNSMKDADWNKHLLTPLTPGEKVIVCEDQTNVAKGYIKVKHGPTGAKAQSIFSKHHFITLTGKEFAKC